MRRIVSISVASLLFASVPCPAGIFDDLLKGVGAVAEKPGTGDDRIVAGLKEAITIGTGNAVKLVSVTDGYFGNPVIRILVPEKMQKAADVLAKVGFRKEVDDFALSMNRAAEKAAPQAKAIFVSAIREMTFEDAKKILDGGDTAAPDFFRAKTSGNLYEVFRPIVSAAMDEVGVTRKYKEIMGRYAALPFAKAETVDLDHHVTNKALEGLFYMVGQEEKKIRTDPAARVTELLKAVFGRK